MKVIKPYVYMRKEELDRAKLYNVEYAARLCYKSEGRMSDEVNETFHQIGISVQKSEEQNETIVKVNGVFSDIMESMERLFNRIKKIQSEVDICVNANDKTMEQIEEINESVEDTLTSTNDSQCLTLNCSDSMEKVIENLEKIFELSNQL